MGIKQCTECGKEMNADFNAARNIAMSTDFLDKKCSVEEMKIQHEKYLSKHK